MNYKGFELHEEQCGAVLDFVMPRELEGKFFARLYARGEMGDLANGDPSLVWEGLKHEYGSRALVAPRQVHGVGIIEASAREALPMRSDADGVFVRSGEPALASLRFADCAPVVITGVAEEPWLLALHSGFKGTLLNISGKALARLSLAERSAPRLWAWIGPSICGGCYSRRTDDPTTRAAIDFFADENVKSSGDFVFFDIKGEIGRRLAESGVPEENIFVYGGCTLCESGLFYSYRAGDEEKRNFLLAGCAINHENM